MWLYITTYKATPIAESQMLARAISTWYYLYNQTYTTDLNLIIYLSLPGFEPGSLGTKVATLQLCYTSLTTLFYFLPQLGLEPRTFLFDSTAFPSEPSHNCLNSILIIFLNYKVVNTALKVSKIFKLLNDITKLFLKDYLCQGFLRSL